MNDPVPNAVVKWKTIKPEQSPKVGDRIGVVARFEKLRHLWSTEAWSVVLVFTSSARTDGTQDASASMLMPNAPQGLLDAGSRFEIMQGNTPVADVVIQLNSDSHYEPAAD